MLNRGASEGFVSKQWHWLVASAALALSVGALVFYISSVDKDPEEEAASTLRRLDTIRTKTKTGVKAVDTQPYARAVKNFVSPQKLSEVDDERGSYLVSAARVYCEICQKPIVPGSDVCSFCGKEQPKVVAAPADTDNDGMTDDYEMKHSLNPALDDRDLDLDGDGFTNYEEFLAKTDPSGKLSHPDYLDSLRLEAPLRETVLPFYFEKVLPIPGGKFRFYFRDPSKKGAYGQKGLEYRVLQDQEIGKTGFAVKSYEKKTEKRSIKGGNKMEREVDISEATIERISDKRVIVLRIGEKKKPVDIQAKLIYDRRGIKEFIVVPGEIINLNGAKYRIKDIRRASKEAIIEIEDVLTREVKTLKTLEN